MGLRFFDQYSLLHFSVGVVAFFWGMPLTTFFIIHSIFEYLENTRQGILFIQRLPLWPGGKFFSDSSVNILGDTVFAVAGFATAKLLDAMYKRDA